MFDPTPPSLETLDLPASWLNKFGNLDRSACLEVRVSEVRRLFGCVQSGRPPTRHGKWKRKVTLPFYGERPAHTSDGRTSTAVVTLTDLHLLQLTRPRLPRRIAGDWRTLRAPAMRPAWWGPPAPGTRQWGKLDRWKGFHCRVHNNQDVWSLDQGLSANPNRGATRTKTLGLADGWTQPVRVERWHFPGGRLPKYYLVCPCGTGRSPGARSARGHGEPDDPRLPGLSTAPRGAKRKGCPQRVLFLFLVLCTEAERRDAAIARLWVRGIPPSRSAACATAVAKLTARYGPIFEPRTLVCRQCLGLKYGNHPETARRSWQRRRDAAREAAAARAGPGSLEWVRKAREAVMEVGEVREARDAAG